MLEKVCSRAREVWVIGTRMNVIEEALKNLGIDLIQGVAIESHPIWKARYRSLEWEEALELDRVEQGPDWIITTNVRDEEHSTN